MPILDELFQDGRRIALRLRFGAGLASAPSPQEIDVSESSSGFNFDLALDSYTYKPRKPFDLSATAPNAEAVRGFVELIKSDGSVTSLVQAGGNVYSWDGDTTFTLVGTVNANSRLRGGRDSTSGLDDKVVITDLEKLTVVKTWDGATFEDLAHNLGGDFFAKYCIFNNERAFYYNVRAGATDTPHLLVGSARGTTTSTSDFATLTTSNRPSSARSDEDAFYIPVPDLKAGNGIIAAFGKILLSTEGGQIWVLNGSSPIVSTTTDAFSIEDLYSFSAAEGDESIVNVGNDVIYGRAGSIETVAGADTYGDVKTDDVSRWVEDQINGVKSWDAAVYNPRLHKAYFWPTDGNEIWVLNNSLYNPRQTVQRTDVGAVGRKGLSPWTKWETAHGNQDFRTSAAMLMRRPTDKLDHVFVGGPAGEIFQLEGSGLQDGGTTDIVSERTSGLIQAPAGSVFNITGYIKYRKEFAATLTLDFLFGGATLFTESLTITMPGFTSVPVFGGNFYFGGTNYFGVPFTGRLVKQPWSTAGSDEHFQVNAKVTGADFDIEEIYISFERTA